MAIRLWGSVLVSIVMLGLVASCGKQTVQFDRRGLEEKVAARIEAVLAQPGVDKAFEELMEAMVSEPALQAAGASLFEALSADPKIAAPIEKLMEDIQTLPPLKEAVRVLMARNPDATPDQIGELVGTRMSSAMDSPQAGAVFDALGKHVMQSAELSVLRNAWAARIERTIGPEDEARWSKRLIELNGDSVPSPARATELYLEHAWNARRLEKPVIALLANATARRETAKLLAAAFSHEEVATQLRRSAAMLVQDSTIQAQVLEVFSRSLEEPRNEEAVGAAVRALLLSKPVLDAVDQTMAAMIKSPEIGRRAAATFNAIAAEREVRAAFDDFMNRW